MRARSRVFATGLAAACLIGSLATSVAIAAPMPAWAPLAASGPTNLPPVQSEVQRIAVDAEGGTYTLAQTTATGSGTLSFGQGFSFGYAGGATEITVFSVASGAFHEGQVASGTGIEGGTTVVAVSPDGKTITLSQPTTEAGSGFVIGASKEVTGLSNSLGSFHVGDAITGTGIPGGTTVESVGAGTLMLSQPPTAGGTSTLSATETTAAIGFDAEASALEAALDALPALDVAVTGGPGGKGGAEHHYSLIFGGEQADTNVPELSADSASLTGNNHHAAVYTAVEGGQGTTELAIYAQNVGGLPSSNTVMLEFSLPSGIMTTATPGGSGWSCAPGGAGQSSVSCETSEVAQPGLALPPLTPRSPPNPAPKAASSTSRSPAAVRSARPPTTCRSSSVRLRRRRACSR